MMTTITKNTATNNTGTNNTITNNLDWLTICNINDIAKNTGVCADFNGKQVAIFHIKTASTNEKTSSKSEVKAITNLDPFAKANVLSRGLITEKNQQYFVASPLLKQEFCLNTGQCQQDDSVVIATYKARIDGDLVQLMEI
jgi:nitrite reductase (NADH) small subunit